MACSHPLNLPPSLADPHPLLLTRSLQVIRIMATRCMFPAAYFCSGEVAQEDWHHYGLAAPIYTHFTSPIRRSVEVVVDACSSVVMSDSLQTDKGGHIHRRGPPAPPQHSLPSLPL